MISGDQIYLVEGEKDYEWIAEALGTEVDRIKTDTRGCPFTTFDTTVIPDLWCYLPVDIPSLYGVVAVTVTNDGDDIVVQKYDNLTMLWKLDTDINWFASVNGYSSPSYTTTVKKCETPLAAVAAICDMTISTSSGASIEVQGAPGEHLSGSHIYLPKNVPAYWRKFNSGDSFSASAITCSIPNNVEGVPTNIWSLTTTRRLQSKMASTSTPLLSSILKSNFTGASGPVQFGRDFVKGRNYDGITVGVYNIQRHLMNGKKRKWSPDAFLISIWREGVGWIDVPGAELMYRDGSTQFLGVYRRIYNAHYITPIARMFGLGLMVFAWLSAILSMGFIGWLRKNPIIQRGQPLFMHILCTGSLISSTTIFAVSFDEYAGWTNKQLSIACSLAPWFFFIGHILIFCSLFIKLWRVNRVLQLRRTAISALGALQPLLLFLTSGLVVLIAHSVYDPWSWNRFIISEVPAETYGMCKSNHAWAFFLPLVFLLLVAEAIALYFAWKTSIISSDFQDSTPIFYTCLMQVQSWLVGVPLLAFIGYSSADATYFARVFLIWVFSSSGVMFVVVPKIVKTIKFCRNPKLAEEGRRASVSGVFLPQGSGDSYPSSELYPSKESLREVKTSVQKHPGAMISTFVIGQIQEEDRSSSDLQEEQTDHRGTAPAFSTYFKYEEQDSSRNDHSSSSIEYTDESFRGTKCTSTDDDSAVLQLCDDFANELVDARKEFIDITTSNACTDKK